MLNVDITGKMFNVCTCLGWAAAAAASQSMVEFSKQVKKAFIRYLKPKDSSDGMCM